MRCAERRARKLAIGLGVRLGRARAWRLHCARPTTCAGRPVDVDLALGSPRYGAVIVDVDLIVDPERRG
jgi:hypothetical protein